MNSQDNFNLNSYEDILRTALENDYKFLTFDDIGREDAPRTCLLRHDIDSELLDCGGMLDVEAALSVRATYFLMTRSTAYNLFSLECSATVDRILKGGHQIALHFMGERCDNRDVRFIVDEVLREAQWLKQEFGTQIGAVSFHQPTTTIIESQIEFPGMINTYNASQMAPYYYISDTNMIWRHEHPLDIFSNALHMRLQLLIHPMWWTRANMSMIYKWRRVLQVNEGAVISHWKLRERTLNEIDLSELGYGK